jgi:tetratricopeptide (TPR) repeat protein/predicted aspartyl protease
MLIASLVRRSKCFALCVAALAVSMVFASSARAENKCKLIPVGELPITMAGLRPLITAQINGKDAQFVLDSGAFFSVMSAATATEFDLKVTPFGLKMVGIGGVSVTSVTAVKEFGLMGFTFRNAEFLVGGSEVGASGVLGQNLLSRFDVEYDLAKGVARLFRTENCETSFLAYWISQGQAYSSVEINKIESRNPHTIGVAYVNGKQIRALFDTGAPTSALSLKAAERAGIKVDSPGVKAFGYARGFGRGLVKQYIAVFPSFKLGDGEEIKNTRLRIADINLNDAEMLIGADFFLSHRVFVSNSQRKLYLTYNGGPVFNLTGTTAEESSIASDQAEARKPGSQADDPADAAEYFRRGAASVSRHDFEHGLSDLSKAIELNPNDAEYFHQRANAYRHAGQTDLALADLDRALSLKADFQQAHFDRAEVYFSRKNTEEGVADLDAVDHLAAPQADLRLRLAGLYSSADAFTPAIAQLDLWIKNHPTDSRFVYALATRCWTRALQNQDLAAGLSDCDRASKLVNMRLPDNAGLFSNRGMIRLRQGEYKKAIDDFDDALKLQPKNAVALYARGVAKSKKNKNDSGQVDIDAAETLAPKIGERYKRYGIAP